MEVLKNQYIAEVHVLPDIVGDFQAGIDLEALRQTHMIPFQEKVFITNFDGKNKPIFFQQMYQVVPLEENIADLDEVVINNPVFEDRSWVILNDVLRGLL